MRRPTARAGAAGALLPAALLSLTAAPASAADVTADYTCALDSGLNTDQATLRIDLNTPAAVTAGETVSLTGRVELTLGKRHSQSLTLLGRKPTVESHDLPLAIAAGSTERTVRLADVKAGPISDAKPLVMRGDVSVPTFTAPGDADLIRLAVAQDSTVASSLAFGPKQVTFTAVVPAAGALAPARKIACWDGKVTAQTTIAVTAPAGLTPPGAAGAPALAAGPGAGVAPDALPPGSLTDGPAAAGSAARVAPVSAPIPPATRDGSIVLPYWALIALGIALPLLTAAYTLFVRRHLRRLKTGTR